VVGRDLVGGGNLELLIRITPGETEKKHEKSVQPVVKVSFETGTNIEHNRYFSLVDNKQLEVEPTRTVGS